MPGFSLTVMVLPREGTFQFSAEKMIEFLDAATDAPGWPWHACAEPTLDPPHIRESGATQEQNRRNLPLLKRTSFHQIGVAGKFSSDGWILPCARINTAAVDSDFFIDRIKRAAAILIAAEAEITRQDVIAGDGDAGLTLQSGAKGALASVFSCSGV